MTSIALPTRSEVTSVADAALKAAARFWFLVAVSGQVIFALAVASFYGSTALRGDYYRWSRSISHGLIRGDKMGNLAVVVHLASAVVITLAGVLQLIPRVRNRFPVFHRWNGRVYMVSAVTVSAAGLYMTWIRGSVGDVSQHLGSTLNAVLIWICAAMALRYAVIRDFKTHRRWALRLFIVVSASWFIRLALYLTFLIFRRPVGFDPTTFRGPLLTALAFGQYIVPLAVLELYLRAQNAASAAKRMAMAGALFVLTLAMGAGIFAVTMARWVPDFKVALDTRKSIARTLSKTIEVSGVENATQQYHRLKTAAPFTYNFDQGELNSLGYQLVGQKKLSEAIRIFQLNVEAYPKSSNVYDSLGEAYLEAGNKPQAIANYQIALQLNPKNRTASSALQKLGAAR